MDGRVDILGHLRARHQAHRNPNAEPDSPVIRRAAPLLLSLVTTHLLAQAPPPQPRRAEFSSDLSFVSTSGNTRITTSGFSEKFIIRPGWRWTFTQSAGVVYGRSNGDVNAENYRAAFHGEMAFSARTGLYALGGFERNVFRGIAARYESSVGLSALLWVGIKDELKFEAGLARISQRPTAGQIERFFSARINSVYRYNFRPSTYFEQAAEILPNLRDRQDLRINARTALVAPISAHIGLKMSYLVQWDNEPQPTFRKTDTTLQTGLQLTF